MAQQIKDLAWSLLWLRFAPWPRNFHMPQVWPKKKFLPGRTTGGPLICSPGGMPQTGRTTNTFLWGRIFWDYDLTALFENIGLTQQWANLFCIVNIFSFAVHPVSVITMGTSIFQKVHFMPLHFFSFFFFFFFFLTLLLLRKTYISACFHSPERIPKRSSVVAQWGLSCCDLVCPAVALVTAVAQVQSLAQELPHAMGTAKKKARIFTFTKKRRKLFAAFGLQGDFIEAAQTRGVRAAPPSSFLKSHTQHHSHHSFKLGAGCEHLYISLCLCKTVIALSLQAILAYERFQSHTLEGSLYSLLTF